MKIVVIGLGSMGKRRIRLIKNFNSGFEVIGVDLNAERCHEVEELFSIETAPDISGLSDKKVDCAFITTSPATHAQLIRQCLEFGWHIFTELNLSDEGYEENTSLAKEKNKVIYMSSTMQLRKEIQYIMERVQKEEMPLHYQYHIGQYLPDWHPWEDYRDFFVGKKETNGCREILAIELPWLTKVFGSIREIKVIKGKLSQLEIDYDDTYSILLRHEYGAIGSLNVNVVARKAIRNFLIIGENMHITWNGTPEGLVEYDISNHNDQHINLYEMVVKERGYSDNIIENAYYAEVEEFFAVLAGEREVTYTLAEDQKILQIIDQIEGIG